MSFGEQLRKRREELGMSRDALAEALGVSRSAIGNYETGVSVPKEDVLLRMFDALRIDPNYLYQGSFRHAFTCTDEERRMVEKYRVLPLSARQLVHTILEGLSDLRQEWQQGDSMAPWIADGAVVYVNHDPLQNGDVGIFCVDGDMLCKQYYRDPLGMVYLFSLNRKRADMDVVFHRGSGRSLTCFGRVMMHGLPLPE